MEEIKVRVRINAYEKRLLDELIAAFGWNDDEEVFRHALRFYHQKELSPQKLYFKKRAMKEALEGEDPETVCLARGGEVTMKDDGTKECRVQNGALEEVYVIQ